MRPSIHVLFKKRIQASISWRKGRYSWISDVLSLKTDEMLSCESTVHKLCVTWDRSWCSAIGYLVQAGLFFALKWTCCAALCCSHRCETDPPPPPRGSVHVTPARRLTAVQDVLSITPAAKEEQPLSLSVAAVFKSVRADSGHLLHVKVYKRNYRLLPLFSVGQISYVNMHDFTDY